ncbi:MAG: hypothetical protein OXK74_14440 [Gemmatimonadota bacterium]|nr:hypothetical protein [Gemmatimonadota bacterium]
MTGARASGRLCTGFAIALASLTPPGTADAQVFGHPYLGAGYADGFAALVGVNFLKDLGPGDDDARYDEARPVLHAFAAAGVRASDARATGALGLGVLFPTGLGYVGPLGIGAVRPWGGGGGVRLAAGFGAGPAWLTAGVIRLEGRGGVGALVILDLSLALVCDATPVC